MKKGNLRIDNFAKSTEGIFKLTLRDVPRQASYKYSIFFSPSHNNLRVSEEKEEEKTSCTAKKHRNLGNQNDENQQKRRIIQCFVPKRRIDSKKLKKIGEGGVREIPSSCGVE